MKHSLGQVGDSTCELSIFEPDGTGRGSTSPFHVPGHDFVYGLSTPASFLPDYFHTVMLNLIKNPNLTSSFLYRADIFYDSDNDASYQPMLVGEDEQATMSSFVKHLKQEYQPVWTPVNSWAMERTVVRQLVPRNPKVDEPLVQTCHLLAQDRQNEHDTLVLLLPHVHKKDDVPFYHPSVRGIAFLYRWSDVENPSRLARGALSIHLSLFDGDGDLAHQDSRLNRTLLRLLETTHKHATGLQNGYQVKAPHDQIVPQRRFQEAYTKLKGKYAKHLIETWHEVTDPSKHVFEDLGIAAFLIELWTDMYDSKKHAFPGFVDVGCGNGLLVHILTEEGYPGWGFDVRKRKSWSHYPEATRFRLEQKILVPGMFQQALRTLDGTLSTDSERFHDGFFPKGTFIISNHADELTVWTPVLAGLSQCPFVSIPCCSHSFSGERFRAPPQWKSAKTTPNSDRSCTPSRDDVGRSLEPVDSDGKMAGKGATDADGKGGKTGSLKRPSGSHAPQYATLCAYVESIADRMGYAPKKEQLRIPSTRKTAILGLDGQCFEQDNSNSSSEAVQLVEQELSMELASAAQRWIERAQIIASTSSGANH